MDFDSGPALYLLRMINAKPHHEATGFRRTIELVLGVGCLVLISGCAVGPNYHAPAAPDVSGYTPDPLLPTVSSDVGGGTSQSFVPAKDIPGDWWTLFHSPGLNQLILEALKNNPTLEAAQASLREARENVYA